MTIRPCSVDGCERRAHARGWCGGHYRRWYLYGDPNGRSAWKKPTIPIHTRFWSRVDFSDPDGCWLWTGARRHRYGEVWWNGGKVYAHRAAYELVYGAIEDGLMVRHRCDTPLCCRPDHLLAGTQQDNMRDMVTNGRWRNQFASGPNAPSLQ